MEGRGVGLGGGRSGGGGDPHHQKVPVWIGTDCKLLSGITKFTTCQDVIRSLVHSQDPTKWSILEKWRKMERKLDPSVRILKVWKAWGDQKNDVAFILRHSHSADGYIDKRMSSKIQRRKSSASHHSKLSNQVTESDEGIPPMTESMEHLLKLVITQGETIQAQLKKLRHQEEQIERYEERMHRLRSLQDGENYVVESYLRDEKNRKGGKKQRDKSPRKSLGPESSLGRRVDRISQVEDPRGPSYILQDSPGQNPTGVDITTPSEPRSRSPDSQDHLGGDKGVLEEESVAIIQQSEILERICEVNAQLTKEEERVLKLGFKLKKLVERRSTTTSVDEIPCPILSLPVNSPEESTDSQILTELEALRNVTCEQAKEIERNEESLTQLEQFLDGKQDQVTQLRFLVEQVDRESEILQERLQQMTFQRDLDPPRRKQEGKEILIPPLSSNPQQPCTSTISCQSSSPSSEDSLHSQCLHSSCSNQFRDGKKICKDQQDTDSNSDTGISSLHSSGDENTNCVLDTLV